MISITFLLSAPTRKSDFNRFFPLAVFVCGSLAESLGKKGSKKMIEKSARKKVIPKSDRKK